MAFPEIGGETEALPSSLARFAWLSIAAALVTIGLKSTAYLITGSVGLLSDAAESLVNLVAAIVALIALRVSIRPADHNHDYGHGKAEYFSAGIEGMLIFVAAAAILVSSVDRFLHPAGLERLGAGIGISAAASVINGVLGVYLIRVGRAHRSVTLTADGKHLITDVWTSVGVIVGVLLVAVTGWQRLDPVVAALVGLNILITGYRLVSQSVTSLLDAALPAEDLAQIDQVLAGLRSDDVDFVEDAHPGVGAAPVRLADRSGARDLDGRARPRGRGRRRACDRPGAAAVRRPDPSRAPPGAGDPEPVELIPTA